MDRLARQSTGRPERPARSRAVPDKDGKVIRIPEPAARKLAASVDAVQEAAESVQEAADRVDSHVSGTVSPDIREIRLVMAEMTEKTEVRLRRIYRAIGLLAVLQVALFVLILTT